MLTCGSSLGNEMYMLYAWIHTTFFNSRFSSCRYTLSSTPNPTVSQSRYSSSICVLRWRNVTNQQPNVANLVVNKRHPHLVFHDYKGETYCFCQFSSSYYVARWKSERHIAFGLFLSYYYYYVARRKSKRHIAFGLFLCYYVARRKLGATYCFWSVS